MKQIILGDGTMHNNTHQRLVCCSTVKAVKSNTRVPEGGENF